MLMRTSFQWIEVALARIVMPRSRSRSFESSARSATRWFSRKAPDCCSRRSTSVVLPWSTWAMIATLRSDMKDSGWQNNQGGEWPDFAPQYRDRKPRSNPYGCADSRDPQSFPALLAAWRSSSPTQLDRHDDHRHPDGAVQQERPDRVRVSGTRPQGLWVLDDDDNGAEARQQQKRADHDQQRDEAAAVAGPRRRGRPGRRGRRREPSVVRHGDLRLQVLISSVCELLMQRSR